MSRPTTMKKPWLYEKPSYPSTSRMRRAANADTLHPPVTTYSCAPPSPGKKSRRVRPILRPLITNVANFIDADRKSPVVETSPISEGDGSDIYAEGYTLTDHGDLPSPECISPYLSVAAEAHILKTRRKKPGKKGKGSSSANSSFSGLEGDSMFGERKEEVKPPLTINTKTGKDLEEMHFPSPLHKRQFTHPNQPIVLNKLQDLIEFLDIRDIPPTPSTAVSQPFEGSKLKEEPTLVEIVNGSDSETDVDNDVSDTETVVDSAPPDVTKFKVEETPLSPATTTLPAKLERSESESSSDADSPTRAFRSLVSFFHTSPRLRPPVPSNKAKFINKTLKLGEYSKFKSLKTASQIKAKRVDDGDASDSDSSYGTPVFRRTLGPVFVSSPRVPKRKALPVW